MNWPSALAVCELLAPDGSHAPVPLRWRPYSRCLLSVWLHTVSSDPRRILLRPSEREREREWSHTTLSVNASASVCVLPAMNGRHSISDSAPDDTKLLLPPPLV